MDKLFHDACIVNMILTTFDEYWDKRLESELSHVLMRSIDYIVETVLDTW